MYFCINEFEFGVNDSIFSGNEQQKVYNQQTGFFYRDNPLNTCTSVSIPATSNVVFENESFALKF